jgi:serine/threonine-protein kinase SIK3
METTKLICLVTEYASNGELYDYIIHKKRLSEREAKHIFKQIAVALNYCHENHIVHRDVKVENLLLDSHWHVKLADFGFSSLFHSDELLDVFCGSPPYCAPVSSTSDLLFVSIKTQFSLHVIRSFTWPNSTMGPK